MCVCVCVCVSISVTSVAVVDVAVVTVAHLSLFASLLHVYRGRCIARLTTAP